MAKGNGKAPSFTPIVDAVLPYIEKELADCAPELNAAVQVGEGEGSISITVQVKRAKAGRMKCEIRTRVRAPRPPVSLDFHLEDGQLALGFIESEHGTGEGDAEGEPAGI